MLIISFLRFVVKCNMLNNFIFVLLLTAQNFLYSTHYMGGEITWECLSNGNYRFILKLYRECYTTNGGSALSFGNTEILRTTVPGLPNITMTRISLTDMSPKCNPNPAFQPKIFCPGMPTGNANMGALQENIYTSDASYPNGVPLNGVPPPQGWMFYHEDCCRNPCTNIPNATSIGWRLRAIMYPYNNQNTYPCYDNSPRFAEVPSSVLCIGHPFTYNHNAFDPDLDSISFAWAYPLNQGGSNITSYNPGYSYSSPLPSTVHNPNNIPASINPQTGEISFTSFTQGAFVTVVKVSSYRCGQLIAEIFREIQVVLLACGINNPPQVTAPFQDPNTGQYTLYSTSVYAGQNVSFFLSGTDFEFMPDGTTPQTVSIEASGPQFGLGYTNPNLGCLNPPCATLNPPPPISAFFGAATNFYWQTSCVHLTAAAGCGNTTNTYIFLIKVRDDFCPAPSVQFKTISITVVNPPLLDAPKIRCVETLPNGDVKLTWSIPNDPHNAFYNYTIFYSPNISGPYIAIDSIFNYNQTSWVHVGANGNSSIGYYYVSTRSGCFKNFSPIPSDTVSNIFLQVQNNGYGVAQLTWNPISTPTLATNNPWYFIYRKLPGGTFLLIDSTLNTFYYDTIYNCNAYIEYQIFQFDSSGCISRSNIDGDQFQDLIHPPIPYLDYVSVDIATQKSFLSWQASPATDILGYIIYKFNSGWIPIDTISATTYLDLNSNPSVSSESYRIAALDTCLNTSPMSPKHNTIFLQTTKDVCQNKITLNWTPYINLMQSLSHYEIHVSINNLPYSYLDQVSSSTTEYIHTNLNDNTMYCYIIYAVNDDGTKRPSSNISCRYSVQPFKPQFAYIPYVTVVNNNLVEISLFTDISAKIMHHRLERAINNQSTFSTLAILNPSVDPFITYNDFAVDATNNTYSYRFITTDSCGYDAVISNTARTILLKGEQGTELFSNYIYWTEYIGWPTGVDHYQIYRSLTYSEPAMLIEQVSDNVTSYTDIFPDNILLSEGKIAYYVKSIEKSGNPFGFQFESQSNVIFISQPPRIYIPNVFTPGGNNPIFKPICLFVDHQYYRFAIYNRWGEEIFSTNDINQGWDGTYKGTTVQQSTYTYLLQVRFADGQTFQKRGGVLVLR